MTLKDNALGEANMGLADAPKTTKKKGKAEEEKMEVDEVS